MIETIYGLQDETMLVKTTGNVDNEVESTNWVEYRNAAGELVHRSAHVTVKGAAVAASTVGSIG